MKCESSACSNRAPRLYQLGNQFVCAPCVPDEAWKQYPRWRETKKAAMDKFVAHQATGKKKVGKAA